MLSIINHTRKRKRSSCLRIARPCLACGALQVLPLCGLPMAWIALPRLLRRLPCWQSAANLAPTSMLIGRREDGGRRRVSSQAGQATASDRKLSHRGPNSQTERSHAIWLGPHDSTHVMRDKMGNLDRMRSKFPPSDGCSISNPWA